MPMAILAEIAPTETTCFGFKRVEEKEASGDGDVNPIPRCGLRNY
jgi:hypothetical protein